VKAPVTKEIKYWDHRPSSSSCMSRPQAQRQTQLGRAASALTICRGVWRSVGELKLEAQISPLPPVVLGGVLVIPLASWLHEWARGPDGDSAVTQPAPPCPRHRHGDSSVARLRADRPRARKLGYDIESSVRGTGKLRFIEVKGRVAGAPTIT